MPSVTDLETAGVRGVLHRPDGVLRGGLVLAHGAGGNRDAPVLIAAAEAACAAGLAVLRIDLPFRRRRPKGPPSPHTAAEDRAGLRQAVTELRQLAPEPVFLGGHSYGGRQATMLAADEPGLAQALLLLSYPLHPPKKPEQLRTSHFPRLNVPCVFVHGTTDGFGTIVEIHAAAALIPAATVVIPIAGAGHDLKRGRVDWTPAIDALRR